VRPVGPQEGGLHLGTKDYWSERALLTMKRSVLKAKAQKVANMYHVRLAYVGRDDSRPHGYAIIKIKPADGPGL